MKKYKVIDLFCGSGGLSHGFIEAGYDVVLGIDYWKDAIETFTYNHKNSKGLIADLSIDTPQEISKKTETYNADLIIGGPPCQGFSIAGKRIVDDERNKLYKSFVSFVKFYKPSVFLMENVPNIVSMHQGVIKDTIINDFESLGYTVVCKVLLASEFGVPQNRKRAFFVGTKNKKEFIFPEPTTRNIISSEDAISDLTEKSISDGTKHTIEPKSDYQKMIRKDSNLIFNHEITNHSNQTIEIIAMVPDGGNYKNLPIELQKTRNVNIAWTRLNSKKPSFTIDTGHRHHFHYKFNRVPTVRESARIQSFPDSFIFLGSKTSQYKQVGNAVPSLLAKILAETIRSYI
ncbi:MAG: DNA (cytosine-5-)-methyltransferase [Sulfurimonas sp. RIFOXYD12_FULL_36_11]|uniref:DNA cytosine methyltransferase n=1 Tax=Sulfurimonas sp. RIFOXYB12_FULL_35_9 TaxID=1802256 RepID=UPI0008D31815|nr:DNA cytosine methyltransferase [Sulfurimonas sp. RIFOXYB12_FULL_35_9]OHE03579.1 MAG: DNA (cytosine-5-)-methyltransferase [Sulfurimonas sp. RIFOXYB12_FULL_35_9]OHE18521.1 MAG: DNA (cytosine-5-)-methyltransferase [Sulfurimonas sp. RIFOXYD12_FULL_36_11]